MRHYILLLFVIIGLSVTSCRDDFEFEPSTGSLEFSRDTVYLDTVFTNIGSSTYMLKVYNRSNKDIAIPTIKLGKGDNSSYRLMVDGDGQGQGANPGKIFNNVELMAKDSLFIFIETTVDIAEANPTDFLYTDKIEFHSSNGVQNVELVTLIQDAIFLYPQRFGDGSYESIPINEGQPERIYGFYLDENDPSHGNELHWTNTKPYVVYGYAAVPTGKTLTVDAGARVHFHADSGLMVGNGASLKINGAQSATEALENEVIFEGDRLEPGFANISGQWGAVWFRNGSTANDIKNLTLKNAVVGMLVEGNDGTPETLKLHNVQIYNSGNIGILARNARITASNLVVNKAGQAAVALTLGGQYNFTHCTIANYSNAFNQVPLLLSDFQETEDAFNVADLDAAFTNCIFWSSGNLGIRHSKLPLNQQNPHNTVYNYSFSNCLIKFYDYSNQYAGNPLYQFNDTNYTGSVVAKSTSSGQARVNFTDPQRNILTLEEGSGAIGIGITTSFTTDIAWRNRDANPDAGAYEYFAE